MANAPTENLIDLTAKFDGIGKLLQDNGLTVKDPWLGVQFIGAEEVPVSVVATNTGGQYRESGAIYLHVLAAVQKNVNDIILARAETLRDSIRGQRIGSIIIETVSPANFESGATLEFEGGYSSASIVIGYYRDLKIGA